MLIIAWVVLGVALLLFELHHLALYAFFAGAGALAAAGVAIVFPDAIVLQLVVAVAVTVLGIWLARPAMSRAFHRHRGGHVARGVHGGLVGQEALTLDAVGGPHHAGHVRLAGERWLAVSGSQAEITAGTPVVVTAVEGTTLTVWPVDSLDLPPPVLSPPTTDAPDGADRS